MKVDNMREEHQEKLIRDAEKLQQNRRKKRLASRLGLLQYPSEKG